MLRYGSFYGPGASDVLLDMVRKRQIPVIGGGTGIWSFIEILGRGGRHRRGRGGRRPRRL